MIHDLWDVYQQGQINDAAHNANAARRDSKQNSERLHTELQRVNAKIDGLALVCESLWELLQENTDLDKNAIQKKMDEIDTRDGRRDGKMSGKPVTCSTCDRPGHTKTSVCMYCGTSLRD